MSSEEKDMWPSATLVLHTPPIESDDFSERVAWLTDNDVTFIRAALDSVCSLFVDEPPAFIGVANSIEDFRELVPEKRIIALAVVGESRAFGPIGLSITEHNFSQCTIIIDTFPIGPPDGDQGLAWVNMQEIGAAVRKVASAILASNTLAPVGPHED